MIHRHMLMICFSLTSTRLHPLPRISAEFVSTGLNKNKLVCSASGGSLSPICTGNENASFNGNRATKLESGSSTKDIENRSWFRALRLSVKDVHESYNLIWSPGFLRKTSLTFGVLQVVQAIPLLTTFKLDSLLLSSGKIGTLLSNVVLPLMASACCLLQLALNVVATGCAGLNTVLGPIRPIFLGLLLSLTFSGRNHASIGSTLLRFAVAFLPESLHVWNKFVTERVASTRKLPENASNTDVKVKEQDSKDLLFQATVHLDVPSMGCVACINSIDSALQRQQGVRRVNSSLKPLGMKGGEVTVDVAGSSESELSNLIHDLCQVVQDAGFDGCTIDSIRKKSPGNVSFNSKAEEEQGSKDLLLQATVHLDVPSMGCVACINSIDSTLQRQQGVLGVNSSLKPLGMKGGEVTVNVAGSSESELNNIIHDLCQVVQDAGFDGCTIDSIRKNA